MTVNLDHIGISQEKVRLALPKLNKYTALEIFDIFDQRLGRIICGLKCDNEFANE